jgi:ATPase subunit of ABC transporter with duplicated ATPase domains
MLTGEIYQDSGDIVWGSNMHIGYLPQEEYFLPAATVKEEFLKHVEINEGMGRRILNRFKLSADDVHKKVSELSSGERSRLILAILSAKKANCIILDEPSNHLDLEVLDSLEEALRNFSGTLIVVSHDRYFIDRIRINNHYVIEKGTLKNDPNF